MRQHALYWALVSLLAASTPVLANPGEDGDQTIAASNVVINSFTTFVSQAGATFDVAAGGVAALALPAAACPTTACSSALAPGDMLMIYQPQGATIDTATNTAAYGAVTAYGSAGRYEFVYVESIAGDTITIADSDVAGTDCTTGLRFTYSTNAMVIRVPQYSTFVVDGSVLAPAWNGTTGGVVAAYVGGTPTQGILQVNGSISASARGFRGGVASDRAALFPNVVSDFVCTAASNRGAPKGESIAGVITDLCRGAPANGGGGGSQHNSGGGGGANGGTLAGWTVGRGVRDTTFDATAWPLDAEVCPGGVGTCGDNSGGGRGGYSWGDTVQDPLTVAPGNALWGGDFRRIVGGLGGRPLEGLSPFGGETDPYRRVYFGGGGGAGEENNGSGSSGAAGGGLVFLIASDVVGTGTVSANGGTALGPVAAHIDGMGGAGGGGTVVLTVGDTFPSSTLTLTANGGDGGDQGAGGTNVLGSGGGGGGGVILVGAGAAVQSITGGLFGVSGADAVDTEFPPNGATSGASGTSTVEPPRAGAASPFSCLQGPGFTTPTVNAHVNAKRLANGNVDVEFATASEAANAGFRLYAQSVGNSRRVVRDFVPGQAGSMSTSARYRVVLTGIAEGEALYIADIDLLGKETVQGPYAIDAEYGSNPTEVLYDWTQSRLEVENLQQSIRGNAPTVAKLAVSTRGMQRVTHEQLLAGGVDLSGVAAAQIAVITDTGPVPRRMRGPATFGAGSSIEFFGDARDSLWSSGRIYSVLNDASRATDMSLVSRVVASQGVSTYAAELKYAPQVGYYEGSSTGDPWYADRMVANGAATEKQVALSGPAPSNSSGTVEVVLGGGIDWPGSTPDHSVQILLNGSPIATRRWDGVGQARLRIPVVVGSGVNSVTVRLPLDTGFAADIVYIESVTLKYRASASGNGTVFQGKGILGSAWDTVFADTMGDGSPPSIAGAITIGNVSGTDVRAFQVRGGGAVEFAVSGTPLTFYSASFVDDAEMWVGASSAFLTPTVQAAPTAGSLFGAPADWLVISHGAFMPALGDLVARRQSQGLTTKVVDVADVMLKYSAGNPTPESLRRYIADAKSQMGTDYVLLVGADSYDAPGYLSSGSVSFIPTPYATTSAFVRFAPADPLIADTNGDQVPDVAIGRLPVRTLAETQEAVRKILAYETQAASSMQLTAGALDPLGSFQNASESFATGLPVTWQLDRAYVDALGLNPARTALVNSFNQGRSVISYMGHSGPFQWGLTQSKQFDISQVLGTSSNADLPNLLVSQNQPIVLQFACWTTYFVHPSQSTMAQALLLTPNKGASAILGATVVLDQASHDRMAAAMADRLIPGARIGDVMQAAKAELAADANNPAGPEIQFGQILLGDPAQPIR